MRILHTVEFYHPSVGGMQEVVKQLSERLVELGHDVTVATTRLPERKDKIINGVKIEEFNVKGNMVRKVTGEVESYQKFLLEKDFDVITNFAAQQWATDGMIAMLDKIKSKKVFVPTGFSGRYLSEYKEYFESMKVWMKEYDMNIFLSNNYRDINFARENGIKNIVIIPNGAGEDEFLSKVEIDVKQKLNIPKNYFIILHVGSHTGIKGHREAIRIFEKAKIKNAAFVIIGNSFGGGCAKACAIMRRIFKFHPKRFFDHKILIITFLSRKETVSAYKAADLFLFASNIECSPLVLFECMASKTPFLTVDVGNSSEIIEWSKSGKLLPTKKDSKGRSIADITGSARILEELYHDSSLREKMMESGFKAWQERFTWEKIARDYETLYLSLIRGEHEGTLQT